MNFTKLVGRLACIAVSAGLAGAAPAVIAKEWPSRPITVIVPYPAGGGADIGARTWAGLLEKELGVSVNVINRGGGAAVPGHTAIARGKPDGYTIGVVTNDISLYQPQKLADLTYKDMRPLGQATQLPSAVNVNAGSPYQTLQELVDDIKARPGELKATGAAPGVNWHISFLGLMLDLGIDPNTVIWVPTQGGTAGHLDVASGNSDFSTASMAEAAALLESGKLRALTVMTPERLARFPDTPTLKEAADSDWTYSVLHGIAGPKDLPDEIAQKLESALAKVIQSDQFRETMEARGIEVMWRDSQDWTELLAQDLQSTTDILDKVKQ